MDDFRVATGWRNHPKRKKLQHKLGAESVLALFDLWAFCAESRTDGCLSKMDNLDIALAANWSENPDLFVNTLIELKLLDKRKNGELKIHDWLAHNSYVAGHKRRSEKSKKAVEKRERIKSIKSPNSDLKAQNRSSKTQNEMMPVSISISDSISISKSQKRASEKTTDFRDFQNSPVPDGFLSLADCAKSVAKSKGWSDPRGAVWAKIKDTFPCSKQEWAVARSKADPSTIEYKWAYATKIIQKQREGTFNGATGVSRSNATGSMRTNDAAWEKMREQTGGKTIVCDPDELFLHGRIVDVES